MNSRTPQYFREHAAECERLAKEAVDPHNREIFLYAAAKWRMLAAEEAGPTHTSTTRRQASFIRRLNLMANEAELRRELAHMRALAETTTDALARAEVQLLIGELEERLRQSGNGAAMVVASPGSV